MIIYEPWGSKIFFSDSGTISKGSPDNESYFWNNEYIMSLIEENNQVIMPIMFPALYRFEELLSNMCNIVPALQDQQKNTGTKSLLPSSTMSLKPS